MSSSCRLLLMIAILIALPQVGLGRIVKDWTYDRLFAESDVVLIATAVQDKSIAGQLTPPPEWGELDLQPRESTLDVKRLLSGDFNEKVVRLTIFEIGDSQALFIVNGPMLVTPTRGQDYLLFLKRMEDGRFRPTSGYVDLAFSIRLIPNAGQMASLASKTIAEP